jgi:hypothetical protein
MRIVAASQAIQTNISKTTRILSDQPVRRISATRLQAQAALQDQGLGDGIPDTYPQGMQES